MTVQVLSAIYGGIDTLAPQPPQDIHADWLCLTDNPYLSAEGWDTRLEPTGGEHPRLAAKRPKTRPWRYTDADTVVWLDGSIVLNEPWSLRALVDAAGGEPIAQFVHPHRDCIYDEAKLSATMPKYRAQWRLMVEQVEHYRWLGHPANWGLWATGVIVYDLTAPSIRRFGEEWLMEQYAWSVQDQLSEPYILCREGLRPVTLPGDIFDNPILTIRDHLVNT